MSSHNPAAAFIIIGNEILSGRTQDTNLAVLAAALGQQGIELREVRIIPDIEEVIVTTVNALRSQVNHVFTSGGIGPTHDDITSASIAKAFGVPLHRHPDALRMLHEHYPPEMLNAARLKMADVPKGATLIENPVSKAPGFTLENVHVMAGVPRIFKAMLDFLLPSLPGGSPMLSETVSTTLAEGTIAEKAPKTGYFVKPTLFGPVPRDAALAREEVFGPVLAAMPFEDEADAIALANGTDYGLLAAVWTENAGRLQRVAKAVHAGQVFMNCYGAGGGVELPFGGTKRSGHGREKGLLALEEVSTTKTLVHYHG
jgi:molybdenum cofactor synthesis domain-containing protein